MSELQIEMKVTPQEEIKDEVNHDNDSPSVPVKPTNADSDKGSPVAIPEGAAEKGTLTPLQVPSSLFAKT